MRTVVNNNNENKKTLKILIYVEPTTILHNSYPLSLIIKNHIYNWLAKSLLQHDDVEIKTIVPEQVYLQNLEYHHIDELKPIMFKDVYLQEIFTDAKSIEEMFLKIFNNELFEKEHNKFQQIIKDLTSDFEPDIVIDYPIHNNLLKLAYPDALHLLVENGLFSRPPFCRALRFEPIHFLNGFLDKYENEIRNFEITDFQRSEVIKFKKRLQKIVNFFNPQKKLLKKLRKKYKYLLLCPIPADNLYKETYYDDQYLYLLDILNKIPSNVGLIITFHDQCGGQLNSGIVKTLQKKYENLIYLPIKASGFIFSQSLSYFSYCDAIINMHTMTGTQAMLWDLKVISNDKRYSKWFCDKEGLDNLEEFLATSKKDNSNMIYWYMTHFSVFENCFNKPDFYYNYFLNKLKKFKENGISFELFEQTQEFNSISRFVLCYVLLYYLIGQHLYRMLCFLRKIIY